MEPADAFDVIGLREKVERRDGFKMIAGIDEAAGIACQSRWITGNIDDGFRVEVDDRIAGSRFETGPRRVCEDDIGLRVQGREYILRRVFIELNVAELIEVDREVFTG